MLLRAFLHWALIWLNLHNLILIISALKIDIWKSCHPHIWHLEILIRLSSQIDNLVLIYLLDLSESCRWLKIALWAWFPFYLDVISLNILVQVVENHLKLRKFEKDILFCFQSYWFSRLPMHRWIYDFSNFLIHASKKCNFHEIWLLYLLLYHCVDLFLILQGLLQILTEYVGLLQELRKCEFVICVGMQQHLLVSFSCKLMDPFDVPFEDADLRWLTLQALKEPTDAWLRNFHRWEKDVVE